MKKLFSYQNKILSGYLLIAICSLFSCKKLIEIPANPATQINRAQQFADSTSTLTAVAGVYTYARGGGLPYSDANLSISTALSAQEISFTGGYGDQGQFSDYTLTSMNTEIATLWSLSYQSIYQVNDVLAGITNNSNLSTSFLNQITGEMEVARGFYYFNLVNLFGGVPLITTTDYSKNAQLARSSISAVYAQIITDLNDAVKILPAAYPSAGHVRPNLYTALALMAKVNLYQNNWQAAYNEADSVINQGDFSMEPNLNNVFLDGSQEAIWQVPNASQYNGTAEAGYFLPYSSDQTPSYTITDSLLNQFETGDLRKISWLGVNVDPATGQNLYFPAKYLDRQPTSPPTDYMLLRFAEMYLIRAEAAAQLGSNLSVAVSDINKIRQRAGLTAVNPTTQTAMLAAVRKERRTELFTEWG